MTTNDRYPLDLGDARIRALVQIAAEQIEAQVSALADTERLKQDLRDRDRALTTINQTIHDIRSLLRTVAGWSISPESDRFTALIREAADRLDGNLPAPFDFIRTAPESPTVPASGFLSKGTRVRYGDHIGRTDVHSARKGEYYVIFQDDAIWLPRDAFTVVGDDE